MSPIKVRPHVVLIWMFLSIIYGGFLYAQDDTAELFSEVFGAPPQKEDVVLSVSINGFAAGQIAAVTDFSSVEIYADELISLLQRRLIDDIAERLPGLIGSGLVPVDETEVLGIEVTADLGRLRLIINVPPAVMAVQSFGDQRSYPARPYLEPERLSGYVNLYGRLGLQEETQVLSGTIAPSLWVDSIVLTSEMNLYRPLNREYLEDEEAFTLRSYQLFRDFRTQQVRLSVGTVIAGLPGPFTPPEIIGIDLDRTVTMDVQDRLMGQRQYRFTVPDDGVYRVEVNDRLVESERVPRGSYLIRDMRLQNGLNRVTIDPGGEELIPWSPRLVTEGRHVYRATMGVYRAEPSQPVISGHWLWGVHPQVTVGSILQADGSHLLGGVTARTATVAGITEATVGGSFIASTGPVVTLDHTVSLPLLPKAPSVSVGGEYRGHEFRGLEDDEEIPGARIQGGTYASVGYEITEGPRISLTGRWRRLYSGDDRISAALSLHQSIGATGSLSIRLGPEWQQGTTRWRGAIYLRLFPGGGQVATSVTHNIAQGGASVSVYPQGSAGIRRFRWNAQATGFDHSPGSVESLTGRLGYDAYRWMATATPRVLRDVDTGETQLQANFEGATAIVFAGSSVSVSQPVRGAFAMFVPRDTIQGYPVGVQPIGDDYRSIIGRLPGVVPSLRQYRSNVVNLDGTTLPEGLSLGASSYWIDPVLNAGYRVLVGSDATVYVTGTLVDTLNRTPGLAFGVAIDEEGMETMFFSNEEGYFEIHELTPGRYTLAIEGEQRYTGEIVIPAESRGHIDLGMVVVNEGGDS